MADEEFDRNYYLDQLDEESRKKAEESEAILALQLNQLEGSFDDRIAQVRQEQEEDRATGRARAEELFPEGSLGRVNDSTSELDPYLATRGAMVDQIKAEAAQDFQTREQALQDSLDKLYGMEAERRDPNSDTTKLARSVGNEQINRAMQTQLRSIGAQANALGVRGNAGATNDAYLASTIAKGNLERDLMLGNLDAADRLALAAEDTKAKGLAAKEDLRARQTQQVSDLQGRLEELQGAIREDKLRRQLINLDQQSREVFGRLGTEENVVAQGVAERSGVRQQVISEASQAEATRSQREAERLRQAEIDKPPPSGGGGKIICTEMHRQGYLSSHILAGDSAYATTMSTETKVGYWSWARYVVAYMRKSPAFTLSITPFVNGWATEMAYRAGYVEKGSIIGKVLATVGEPLCWLLGKAIIAYWGDKHEITPEVFNPASGASDMRI